MKYFLLSLAVLLLLLSCDSSTSSSEKGDLTGSIFLENMDDHSGITIELYNLADLDPEIVKINNEYPNIGVIVNQQTDFDHRVESPISSTSTDNNGEFKVSNIPVGTYNLVARKDGWGWRNIYEVQITESSNSVNSKKENIYLYPEQVISGTIIESIIIEPFHHLIVEEDVLFLPNSYFELKPNAVCRINGGKKIEIMGGCKLQGLKDNYFVVTSNSVSKNKNIEYYSTFVIEEGATISNNIIVYGDFKYGNIPMYSKINEIVFSNSVISNCYSGIYLSFINNGTAVNNLARNVEGESNAGIYFEQVTQGDIMNNITINCTNGIMVKDYCDPQISNNINLNNFYGIQLFASNSIVTHNTIDNCTYGMRLCGISQPQVSLNQILNSEYGFFLGYSGYYTAVQPAIHNNNISSSRYFYYVRLTSQKDIEAQNNYYFTQDYELINTMIYDKEDYHESNQDHVGTVFFLPILTNKVINAGASSDK